MPDLKRVREAIEQAQDEALAKLRHAQREGQLTDALYLAASQRVVALCLRTLMLLDEAYLQVEGYLNHHDGRSEHHRAWLNDRAASLLQSLERAIADITASALSQVKGDLPNTRPKEKVVKEVIVKEVEPAFLKFVRKEQDLLYLLGLLFLGILSYVIFGALSLAIALPIVWWVFFHKVVWTVLLPIGVLLLIGVFL
jgi:hypothetical protein